MKKFIYTLQIFGFLFLLLFNSCSTKENSNSSYLIKANIDGINNGIAELAKIDLKTTEKVIIDTAIIKDGKFEFKGSLENPYFHSIFINGKEAKINLFLENSEISIVGNKDDLEKLKLLDLTKIVYLDQLILAAYLKDSGIEIINKYPNYVYSAFVAYYYFQINSSQTYLLDETLSNFGENVKQSEYYKILFILNETLKKVAISKPAPNFVLSDSTGKKVQLTDFKGQYVLLEFWASWCAPCRKFNPDLVKAYQKYKNKNFTIVGISVDKSKEDWLKAIADDKLSWTNLSNLNGWDEITDLYGVKAIPQNFLIDNEGIIVEKNIDYEILSNILDEVL